MTNEIRIYTPDMKLKRVLSKEEAGAHYWRDIYTPTKRMMNDIKPKGRYINCKYCGDTVKVFMSNAIKCKKTKCKVAHQLAKRQEKRRGGR